MNILFIWPGLYMGWGVLGKGFEQSAINHGLCAISMALKYRGHYCFMVDMRGCNSWEHFESVVKTIEFDAVLVGFYSVDEKFALEAIERIKRMYPKVPVIVGGVHITYCQVEEFGLADCVIWGEGDVVVNELMHLIENGRALPKKLITDIVTDLDSLPFVDRHLFNARAEQAHPLFPLLPVPNHTINFSRGCPWSCAFCLESKNTLWKKYRARSPENCIEEIKLLEQEFGLGSLMIHDDHLPTGKWIYRFIELWDKEIGKRVPFWCQIRADWICRHKDVIPEMARIGMTWNSLGIEGSQRMLDFYNKQLTTEQVIEAADILHQNQVNIFGNYITGAPTETKEDLDELEGILKRVMPELHSPSIYTSYPGSKLYDFVKENDLWVGPAEVPENNYCMVRWPYERKIKGVDYDKVFEIRREWTQKYRGELREWRG